jgi:hypothetical protein
MQLNYFFDSVIVGPARMNSPQFSLTLDMLEEDINKTLMAAHNLPPATLTNAVYFYCKFQKGSPQFWEGLEIQILK